MKYTAVVAARMTSSRLPGKSMMDILGKPVVERVVERIRMSKLVREVVIATTVNPNDDPIAGLAKKLKVGVYRGSEEDVLMRTLLAAKEQKVEIIVQITGDCPLIDPAMIDAAIKRYEDTRADYTCNDSHIPSLYKPSYPRGFDVEVFSTTLLEAVSKIATDPFHKEHVTLYIYEHPEKYKISIITAQPDEYYPELRVCVDTKEDLEFVRSVYEKFYHVKPCFSVAEIVALAKNEPSLARINITVKQKGVREK